MQQSERIMKQKMENKSGLESTEIVGKRVDDVHCRILSSFHEQKQVGPQTLEIDTKRLWQSVALLFPCIYFSFLVRYERECVLV